MKYLHTISFWLVIIGGLNWLLVGLFSWDVGMIFGGQGAALSRIIYVLVGLSALYLVFACKDCCAKGCCAVSPKETPRQDVPVMNPEKSLEDGPEM